MLDVVRWCVRYADIPLHDALTAASSTPSQALALAGIGRLQPGDAADVLLVDNELSLHAVLRRVVRLNANTWSQGVTSDRGRVCRAGPGHDPPAVGVNLDLCGGAARQKPLRRKVIANVDR